MPSKTPDHYCQRPLSPSSYRLTHPPPPPSTHRQAHQQHIKKKIVPALAAAAAAAAAATCAEKEKTFNFSTHFFRPVLTAPYSSSLRMSVTAPSPLLPPSTLPSIISFFPFPLSSPLWRLLLLLLLLLLFTPPFVLVKRILSISILLPSFPTSPSLLDDGGTLSRCLFFRFPTVQ